MILLTYGTRPEFIKILPLINELKVNGVQHKILFTGQHENLIETVNADFVIKSNFYGENRLDNILQNCLNLNPYFYDGVDYLLVQGDTTSALGLALTAMNHNIKVIHLEAGLRTFDKQNPYPEEFNRVIISKIATIHFCPTENNKQNLLNEGISSDNIYVVGNTGLDLLLPYKLTSKYDNNILITMHRRENHELIDVWFKEINKIAKSRSDLNFILPIHPNPNVLKHKNLLTHVKVIDALPHDKLLELLKTCKLVITDSGGIQEECSFLNKKCLVCRKITERAEAVGLSTFMVKDPIELSFIFNEHIENFEINIKSPFGDGYSAKKIYNILVEKKLFK
jgi:UDP-N-acetylglucosamine 2-epimerase